MGKTKQVPEDTGDKPIPPEGGDRPVITLPGDISLHFKIIRNGLEVGHREFKTIDEAMVGLQLLKNYITNVKAEQKPIPQEDEDGIQQEETKGTEPEEPISGKA